MAHSLTIKGQVTIPKRVREALRLEAGDAVEFTVNGSGEVVVQKAGGRRDGKSDRFTKARGKAEVTWRTSDLMALLRAGD